MQTETERPFQVPSSPTPPHPPKNQQAYASDQPFLLSPPPYPSPLGPAYERLANHRNVGTAVRAGAKIFDSTAAGALRVLKDYPVARIAAFLYILFIHLFVYVVHL